MDYLYGLIGFLGFEGLRIYKLLWANRPIVPSKRAFLYSITLICVATFAGFVAQVFANGNMAEAIYIGFTVPTGLKALCENPRQQTETLVDDIKVRKIGVIRQFMDWLESYFRFR